MRQILVVAGWIVLAVPASAQRAETAHGACVGGSGPVADLGIAALDCPLCRREGASGRIQFVTEPAISRLVPRGPASGLLQPGDGLVAVGGALITTAAGVDSLWALQPGGPVRLSIRRGGALHAVEYQAGTRCLRDGESRFPVHLDGGVAPVAPRPADQAGAGARPAGFGVTFWCTGLCSEPTAAGNREWGFTSAPEIAAVREGSLAERSGLRIGDVVLTVNGVATDTHEGTALFLNLGRLPEAVVRIRRGSQVLTLTVPRVGGRP